jgi:hypothetical protein
MDTEKHAGILEVTKADGEYGNDIFLKLELVGLKAGSAGKRQAVPRGAITFFWNAEKVRVEFVIVVGVVEERDGISAGRKVGEYELCLSIGYSSLLALQRLMIIVGGFAVEDAGPAYAVIIPEIGNIRNHFRLRVYVTCYKKEN